MAKDPTVAGRWIPEDDLLLKNAVEGGASLEALAKGAVQFSHKFTLQELRDRWHSLLYDPDISGQSSAHMFELEISGINPSSKIIRSENNLKGNKEISQKRKLESIRMKYYAMRKKIRSEFFSNSELGLFERDPCVFGGHGTLKHCSRNDTRNVSVDFEGLPFKTTKTGDYSFQEIAFASEQPQLHHLRVQDISAPPLPGMCLQEVDQVSNDMLRDSADCQENRSAVHTVEFADPDSLLNLSIENDILLMDVEEMHAEDQHFSNTITPVIQDSHINNQENDVVVINNEAVTVSETKLIFSPTTSPVVLEATASSHREEINPHSLVDVSSKSSDITEFSDGQICCMLNSEDTEIPCNDDIFLLIHPSTSFGSSVTQPDLRGSVSASITAHGKNYEQTSNFPTKAKDCVNAFGGPQKVGIHRSAEPHSSTDQLLGFSAKTQIADSRTKTLLPAFAYKVNGEPSKGGLVHTISNTPRFTGKEVAGVAVTAFPESVDDSSGSDQDESLIDAEVPYFSDIEAMILEMDLDPYEQDSAIIRQATSYMCDDTKRTIIRLEQSSCSCMQRVMMSQGALAVLYGRHLRHYIRKPEVVLGRSTEDVDVDIDLRKEGQANKISRRQAIIKMEADGSFFLKNLGKSSVSVNGMTIETGQQLNLSSSSLIEIKGMSFLFDINERYVKQYLVNLCQKDKKPIKFERFA